MPIRNDSGTVEFTIGHPDEDWMTNASEYSFGRIESDQGAVSVHKLADSTLRIRISGPFSRAFLFTPKIPQTDENAIYVSLSWGEDAITLRINQCDCGTQSVKDGLGYKKSTNFFVVGTEEKTKLLELAISFDMVGVKLAREVSPFFEKWPTLSSPSVVVEAFAIELYLKSLHWDDHGCAKWGHDLAELFNALSGTTQREIRDAYDDWLSRNTKLQASSISVAFDDVLRESAEAFEKWRYLHEVSSTPLVFSGSGLKHALRDVGRSRFPNEYAAIDKLAISPTLHAHQNQAPVDQ